jgi:hypothetical protein
MTSLNTKPVGFIGIAFFLLALLTDSAFQSALNSLFPQAAKYLSLVFLIAGFTLAYYGKPHTVGGS